MAQKNKSGQRALLEKKIDQFCESSVELLSGIHSKYNSGNPGKSKKRKKRKKKDVSRADLSIDFQDEEPLDDLA